MAKFEKNGKKIVQLKQRKKKKLETKIQKNIKQHKYRTQFKFDEDELSTQLADAYIFQ